MTKVSREAAENLVDQIDQVMQGDKDMSQPTRDKLIMLSLRVLLTNSLDNSSRIDTLEKFKPWLQAMVWLVGVFTVALIGAIIAGKIQLIYVP
jgi:hypothetical protein